MNEERKTALDTLYFVNDKDTDISLEIITGSVGQTSTIHAEINGVFDREANGQLTETVIGNNKTLKGKNLIVTCAITDTSRETNYTELIVRLKGGMFYKEYPLYATVEEEGDTVVYVCVIRFFKPF